MPNIFGLLGYALRVEKSNAGQAPLKLSRNSFEKVPNKPLHYLYKEISVKSTYLSFKMIYLSHALTILQRSSTGDDQSHLSASVHGFVSFLRKFNRTLLTSKNNSKCS